jgi:hypothetical protein
MSRSRGPFPVCSSCRSSNALAQSPLVAELETVATPYHEDPTGLDRVRAGLERAVTTEPDVQTLAGLARERTNPVDWPLKDSREAHALLESLTGT